MKLKCYLLSAFFLLVIALAGCAPSRIATGTPGEASVRMAQISVTPMSGKPGPTPITIYGAGFIHGEKVRLILATDGLDIHLARGGTGGVVEVNEYGAFVEKINGFPMGVKDGVYTLKAEGDKGSVAVAPIEILK